MVWSQWRNTLKIPENMESSRKNMNWWPESFHPSANSDASCIHSISLHSSNRVLLCLNWVGRWARWWSVQKPERKQASYLVKLKIQYYGHLIQRADSLEKTLMLGKTEGRKRRGWQRSRWLNGITNNRHDFEQASGWWRTGKPGVLQSMELQSQTQLSKWTTTKAPVD